MMHRTGFIQSVILQISQFPNICRAPAEPTNIGIGKNHQTISFKDLFNMLANKFMITKIKALEDFHDPRQKHGVFVAWSRRPYLFSNEFNFEDISVSGGVSYLVRHLQSQRGTVWVVFLPPP